MSEEKKKGKFKAFLKKINIKGLVKGLLGDVLQSVPVLGTIVTNFKTDSIDNPKGKIKIGRSEVVRLIIGVGVAYVLYKGMLTIGQLREILSMIGL